MEAWLGTILPVAFNYAPEGWAMAHGQSLRVDQHQGLYSVMLDAFGGSIPVNFALPDLRGRVPLGFGERNGFTYPFASFGGTEKVSLNTNHIPAHTHAATFQPIKTDASVTIPAQAGDLTFTTKLQASSAPGNHQAAATGDMLGASTSALAKPYADTSTSPVDLKGLSVTVAGKAGTPAIAATVRDMVTGGTVTVAPAGAPVPTPVDVRMPYLAINFIVCLQGIYPPKP